MAMVAGIICGIIILCGIPHEFNSITLSNATDHKFLFTTESTSLLDTLNLTDYEDSANFTLTRVVRSMLPTPEKVSFFKF